MSLPTTDKERKSLPVWSGVVAYFPKALLEVARVSMVGNQQHNPGQPLHWARGKSMNQLDTEMRHAMDHHCFGTVRDTDGTMHLAKRAWRALADLELAIEAEQKAAPPPAALNPSPVFWISTPEDLDYVPAAKGEQT